jgi:GntR family transcriptional regulator, galactonate operon transcriptional repressor
VTNTEAQMRGAVPAPAGRALKRNLREQVVDEIGSSIVSGELKPGDLLPREEVLLERYQVSRTVLREALNILAGKGILDARPRRGTVVRPRSEWNQLDQVVLAWRAQDQGAQWSQEEERRLDRLMEVRRIVEPEAVALAAQRGTSQDFESLQKIYDAMAAATDTPSAFIEADLAFHVACLHASKNDFLAPIAHAIRTEMMASLRVTNCDPDVNRDISLPLHKAILEAVLRRDSEGAAKAMRRHLDDTERRRALTRPAVQDNL